METRDKKRPQPSEADREVIRERLQKLLNDVIYHWQSDQGAMRKAERTLIRLIGELARATLRKHEREQRAEVR
jgi:hypothetical protein